MWRPVPVILLAMALFECTWPSAGAAQSPPPGAVLEVVSPGLASCSAGMRVVGLSHAPDGRPVVAWDEFCGSTGLPRVFWGRPAAAGGWVVHEFISDRRYMGGGDGDVAHRLIVTRGDGAPLLVYAAPGPFNEFNTYRINLDATLSPGFASTYLENVAPSQSCLVPAYAPAAGPAATATTGLLWATSVTDCAGTGVVRVNGAALSGAGPTPRVASAVAPDGGQHVLWSLGTQLLYSRRPAGTTGFTSSSFPAPVVATGELALAADGTGTLHAIVRGWAPDYPGDTGPLVYFASVDGGLTWSSPEFIDPWDAAPANAGIHTDVALAVDQDGIPAVAYWKSRQHLWYAKRDGAGPSWNRAQVATRPNVEAPRAVALDFDARNLPVLVYFDQPGNRLVAARTRPPEPVPTTTVLTTSTGNTLAGMPVTLEVTVSPDTAERGTPSGRVDFVDLFDGTLYRADLDPSGRSRWHVPGFVEGIHVIRASYAGTQDFAPSQTAVTVIVHAEPPQPPEIRPIPSRVDLVGSTGIEIPIEVSSHAGGGVSIAVAGLPPGAAYTDEGPAIVAPRLRNSDLGVHDVVVTVTDSGGTASTSFEWRIRDNTVPFVYDPGPQSSLVGRPVELAFHTFDSDNDPVQLSIAALPPGLTLDNATRTIRGSGTRAGTFLVTVRVFDGFESFERTFSWAFADWSDVEVTAALTIETGHQGDPMTRGLLLVIARELGGSPVRFAQAQAIGYDIDLPAGSVFAGVEGSESADGQRLGSCSGRSGRLRCWQRIDGVGGATGPPLDLYMKLHLIMPVGPTTHTAALRADVPLGLDPDTANNAAVARATPTILPATGRRAIVIVVDDNETQRTSTTYRGLADAAQVLEERVDLTSVGVPQAVVDLARALAPAALEAMVADLRQRMSALNTGIKDRLVASVGNTAGCYPAMLRALRDAPSLSRLHPFRGFLDQYNEAWVASCLGEMAAPYYDRVEVLTDQAATFANFKLTVERLHAEGYTMDLLLDIHGCGTPQTRNNVHCGDNPSLRFAGSSAYRDGIVTNGEPFGDTLQSLNSFFNGTSGYTDENDRFVAKAEPGYVRLNGVYMVACWGSNFNQMWIDMGARASNGSEELNYEVLSSPFAFLDSYTRLGRSLDQSATDAYDQERIVFEGSPVGIPIVYDFTWLPDCGHCRYVGDLRIAYEGGLAQALSLWYGHEPWRPVQPVASSRRVGMVAAPVAPGTAEVLLGDDGTGRPLVRVRPASVDEPGTVTLQTSLAGPALDVHLSTGSPAQHYDLSTSAPLSGPTDVCFAYPESRFNDESVVQVLHHEGGAWADRTASRDLTDNVICGTVTSFSPFALVEFVNRAPRAVAGDASTIEAGSALGASVTLDGSRSADPENDALMYAWVWAGGSAEGISATVTLPIGTHVVTLTVTDAYGAASSDSRSITVTPPPPTGRMRGHGHIETDHARYAFDFEVQRDSAGAVGGAFAMKVGGRRRARMEDATTDGRFVSTTITSVRFTDALERGSGEIGAVSFAGEGIWNGQPGFRFEARAVPGDARGHSRAWFEVTILAPDGPIAATVSGGLDGGRITISSQGSR